MQPAARFICVDTASGDVDRRNVIKTVDEVNGFGETEQYASWQRGTQYLRTWVQNHANARGNPTVAGFDGPTWAPALVLDFDHRTDAGQALVWLRGMLFRLGNLGVDPAALRLFFSGKKGFHLEIPAALFGGFEPSEQLHRQLKRLAELLMKGIPFDSSIYDKLRLLRLENSRHGETGLFKVRLTVDEALSLAIGQVRELAARPRPAESIPVLSPIPDDAWAPAPALVELWEEAKRTAERPSRERRAGAVTDDARDRQTVAAIAGGWPRGGPNAAGLSRHTDYLMPIAGFLSGCTSEDHAIRLLSEGAREASDPTFLNGRDYESEIERLVAGSADRREGGKAFTGLPTLAERSPALADVLGALWPAPELGPTSEAGHGNRAAAGDEVPPFPLEVLPPTLRAYVEACAESMVVPPDFVAVPLLVLAGAMIGNAVEIELKPGWREGSNLYAVIVGDPGSKKSPALAQAARPVYRIQKRLAREFDEAMELHEEELARWEGTKKGERGPKPKPPEFKHVVSTDPTTEALAPMLRADSLALVSDEMTGWVKGMDQYRNGKGADRQCYLSMWSRTLIKVDRKGSKPIVAPRPHLSVIGGIQPDLLPELADAARRQDGFVDRLLWAYPNRLEDSWNATGIELETFQAVEELFWRLYNLEGCFDEDGEEQPIVVRFDETAAQLWRDWYSAHAAESSAEGFPRHLGGPWAKLPGQLARQALVLHVVWSLDTDAELDGLPEELPGETLGLAADLLDYFKGHARRAYRHLRRDQRPLVLRVLEALKQHGELNQRALLHDVFKRNLPADRLRSALEELEEAGLARRRDDRDTGGRPATLWAAT